MYIHIFITWVYREYVLNTHMTHTFTLDFEQMLKISSWAAVESLELRVIGCLCGLPEDQYVIVIDSDSPSVLLCYFL